jgi:hypothetical protein
MRTYVSLALSLTLCFSPLSDSYADHAAPVLYRHDTGAPLGSEWVAEFGRHLPGYLLGGFKEHPVILPAGTYQYTFYIQSAPGHLPGLFSRANEAVRLEVFDHTTGERIAAQSFQETDFDRPWRRKVPKRIYFSTWGRGGHTFEPRVYWPGLVSVRLSRVELHTLDAWSESELKLKANRFEQLMGDRFLEDGFVVMRDAKGNPADMDDTALWTGIYAASQAWRFQATRSAQARLRMEKSLWALHRLHHASARPGTLIRSINTEGYASPLGASKDTYTGFFFAVGQCWPYVQNPRLRTALSGDVETLAGHFLDKDLHFIPIEGKPLDLNPYFSPGILDELFRELDEDAGMRRTIAISLGTARRYFRLMGQKPPATFADAEHAVWKHDRPRLEQILIPFLNDVLAALRLMQVNIGRSTRPATRLGLQGSPYERLQDLLRILLTRFGESPQSIKSIQDLKVLPSQALLALNILKVSGSVLPQPNRFERYYMDNLWTGKALLRTVIDWAQLDELLASSLFGDTDAARIRGNSNHLPYLALWDLVSLDKDVARRQDYMALLERHRLFMHNDLNAMTDMMSSRLNVQPDPSGMAYWVLHRYPESRRGLGEPYWTAHGRDLANQFGGWERGRSREPIPPDLRPRDAFLWQRNARSIRGDTEGWEYAPVDYLMAWWLSQSARREAVAEKR